MAQDPRIQDLIDALELAKTAFEDALLSNPNGTLVSVSENDTTFNQNAPLHLAVCTELLSFYKAR
jgi:hypothetical protein